MIGSFSTACRFHGKIQIKSDEIAVLTRLMAANFSLIGFEWITALPVDSKEVYRRLETKVLFSLLDRVPAGVSRVWHLITLAIAQAPVFSVQRTSHIENYAMTNTDQRRSRVSCVIQS